MTNDGRGSLPRYLPAATDDREQDALDEAETLAESDDLRGWGWVRSAVTAIEPSADYLDAIGAAP